MFLIWYKPDCKAESCRLVLKQSKYVLQSDIKFEDWSRLSEKNSKNTFSRLQKSKPVFLIEYNNDHMFIIIVGVVWKKIFKLIN